VLLNSGREPPLLSWPDDESGQAPARLKLPLGGHASPEDHERWQRLPAADREFVFALLSIWPATASLTPSELLKPSGISAAVLAEAAAALKLEAEQALTPATNLLGSATLGTLIRRAARHLQQRRKQGHLSPAAHP
jgi:hypothetical protein